ncbi:MAG: IPT/TIG domain-containing protein [Actinobacteria bacterium]|nr:IPT/TIG domain-containing protein [Actinomycetota bacterium]
MYKYSMVQHGIARQFKIPLQVVAFMMVTAAQLGVGIIASSPKAQAVTAQAAWSTQASWLAPATSLDSVSCPTASVCFAAGSNAVSGPAFYTMGGGSEGTATTGNSGSENTGWTNDSGALPSDTPPLIGISCASIDFCEAVGYNSSTSAVAALAWNGSSWSEQSLPSGTPQLNAISCPSADFCEAVGYNSSTSAVAALTFNGSNWSQQSLPSGTAQLNAISCASADFCEAVGNNAALTFNGLAWSTQVLPAGIEDLYGLSCVSSSFCEAVGWNTGSAVALLWDGTSWTSQSGLIGAEEFTGVSCSSVSYCTAVGYAASTAGSSPAVTFSFNGSAWSQQQAPGGVEEVNGISCASTDSCEAVGDSTSSTSAPIVMSFDGSAWSQQSLPASTPPLTGISCASTNSCEAIGYDNSSSTGAAALAWNGAGWTSQDLPSGIGGLTGISCPSAGFCEAVGFSQAGSAGIALSFDGTSWSQQSLPSGIGGLSGVSCISAGNCEAVGYDTALSFDGTSWSTQTLPPATGQLEAISCVSAMICEAVGLTSAASAAVALSFDGSTWSQQSLPAGIGTLNGVSCTSASTCEAVGAAGTTAAALSFDGSTWSQQSLPAGIGTLNGVSCTSASACEAVGYESGTVAGTALYFDGASWTTQAIPSTLSALGAVSCAPAPASACEAAGYSPSQVVIIAEGSAPMIASISPASGPVSGGTAVTIAGNGFSTTPGTTTVTFGSTPALHVSCPTVTVCTVTAPAGSSPGETVPVKVSTSDGTSASATYTYTSLSGSQWAISAEYPWIGPDGTPAPDLNSISCVSATFCMAVGVGSSEDGSFATIWNGSTWTSTSAAVNLTLPTDTSISGLYAVSCVSATFCMALAPSLPPLLWNGTAWTETSTTSSMGVNDLSCVSATFCMAVGYNTSDYGYAASNAVEIWNGASWTSQSVISTGVWDELYSVSCTSTTFCMTVDGSSTLYWNGSSWAQRSVPGITGSTGYNDLISSTISCRDSFCELIGENSNGAYYNVFSYNGSSWSTTTSGLANPHDVSCISAQLCEVLGYGKNWNAGEAELSKGSAWLPQSTPVTDLNWQSDPMNGYTGFVSCSSGGFCMALGWTSTNQYILSLDIPLEPSATPQVSSISPSSGSVAGGTSVTIKGTNFSTVADGTTVDFGPGNPAPKVLCASTTTCTVTVPPALPSETSGATVNVTVTTGKGTSNSKPYLYDIPVTVSLNAVPWSSSNTVSFTAMVQTSQVTVMTEIGNKCPNPPIQPPSPNTPINIPAYPLCETTKTAQPVTSGTVTISASPGGSFCTIALPSGPEGNEITCAQTFSSDAGGVIVTASYTPPSSGSPIFGSSTSTALFLQFGACAPDCSFSGTAAVPTAIINIGASSDPYVPGYTDFSATVVNGECSGGNSVSAPVTKGGSCYQPEITVGTFSFLANNGSGTYTPIPECTDLPVTGVPVTCGSPLAPGSYQVVGKYLGYSSGSTIYAPSESKPPISVVVGGQEADVPTQVDAFGIGQANTTTGVTFDAIVAEVPSAGGQIVTVGTVKFVAGNQVLCGPVAYSSSAGDFNCTSNPPAGSFQVVAEYSGATTGTATYYPSQSSAESLTIAGLASTVATEVANFGMGQASSGNGTTFSADVIPQNSINTGGQAIPGGTVTFEIPSAGQVLCGPVDLSGGQASCTSNPDPGLYTVVASYSGFQSNGVTYQPSESTGLVLQVNSQTSGFNAAEAQPSAQSQVSGQLRPAGRPDLLYQYRMQAAGARPAGTGDLAARPMAVSGSAGGILVAPPAPSGTTSAASAISPYSSGTATATNDGTVVSGNGAGALTVAQFPDSFTGSQGPAGSSTLSGATAYLWIGDATGSNFTSITISDCNLNGGSSLDWWNGTAWESVSTANYASGQEPCVNATLLPSGTSPTIGRLTGTVFAVTLSPNAPYIDSMTPSSSPLTGGGQMVITGTHFTPDSYVSFGSTVLASSTVTVNSTASITVTVPPSLSPGILPVTVTTSAGTSNAMDLVYVSTGMSYIPLAPYRAADTRCQPGITLNYCSLENLPTANQDLNSPTAGMPMTIQISGTGSPGDSVTPTAQAVVATVTVVASPQARSGYLSVYPAGTGTPMASSLNYSPGEIVPNLVTVALGQDGAISIVSSSSAVNVIVDVEGYYSGPGGQQFSGAGPASSMFEPLNLPARLVDTRCSAHPQPSFCTGENLPVQNAQLLALGPGASLAASVTGIDSIPLTATAVSLVVTAASPEAQGYLTVWPDGQGRAVTSNVNFTANSPSSTDITVPVGAGGQVEVYNGSGKAVDVVVDVTGYFSSSGKGFTPSSPVRICDTRGTTSVGGTGDVASGITGKCANSDTPVSPSSPLTIQVAGSGGIPASAKVVVANVTAISTPGAGGGYLTAWPGGAGARPATSNLNWNAGQVIPGMVVCALNQSGQMEIYTSAVANVVVDIAGWYS